MYASSLQRILRELSIKDDFGHEARDSFERRFRALRGCALLPRGREERARRLTRAQLVSAILSVAATQPAQAGFVAIILAKLMPAGGPAASFHGAATLAAAISVLIEQKTARHQLKRLVLSSAEAGTNSHGFAELHYLDPEKGLQAVYFVGVTATSLTGPGGETQIDGARRYAKVSRETVLNAAFFDELAREIELSAHWPAPEGDGDEYSVEEAEARRREKLGVRPGSTYLNIGVVNHVTWPVEETLIKFDRYSLVLMPRTPDKAASVHIDLTHNRLSQIEALTVINRFLSVMTWVDDHHAIAQDGWSGNPVPVAVSKRELAAVVTHRWIFDRSIPQTAEAQRALAFYREARNAQENFSVSYAVLNFYKVLELPNQSRGDVKNWVRDNFSAVEARARHDEAFARLHDLRGTQPVQDYIYTACRVAVSHASDAAPSDPDDAAEIQRLHVAADVLRWLARHRIVQQFEVSERPWEEASGADAD